ncbi:hypothetical protein L6164_022946 [Bauhinia variegata]|uniref:Uncharacterized protein n=1 Tax=Bauhinia variegata TaxID=167791 RepID=A0ACB9MH58_BAUVA|nr:hypothetical protein L6164_022946 [Bauhinia variegata]
MASAAATTAGAATEQIETKTYWCHECDMSVALTTSSSSSSPSTLLCPHCHTHFLELMDSPLFSQSDTDPLLSSLSLFDTPYLHRLLHQHPIPFDEFNDDDDGEADDEVEDPLPLLSSQNSICSSKFRTDSIPTILVTSSLLAELDPSGVLCAVCKDPICVDAEAKQLPCKHLYHSDCIIPWLAHHSSCPLCRFQLAIEEEEGAARARRIRRQLRTAMMRLSELMEEDDDFYGFRTTLSHIAYRHGLVSSATLNPSLSLSSTQMIEAETISVGVTDYLETLSRSPVERGLLGSPVSEQGQAQAR